MKKFLLSVIIVLTATLSFAQNQSQHLSFKGVPIDGALNEYVSKMNKNKKLYLCPKFTEYFRQNNKK